MRFLRVLALLALGIIVIEVSLYAWRQSGAWWLVAAGGGLTYAAFLSGVFFGDKNIWLTNLFKAGMEAVFSSTWIAAASTIACIVVAAAGAGVLWLTWAFTLTIQVAASTSGAEESRPAVDVIVTRISPDTTPPHFLRTDRNGVVTFPVEKYQVLNIWVRLQRKGGLQEAETPPRQIDKVPDFVRIEIAGIREDIWKNVTQDDAPAAPKVSFEKALKNPTADEPRTLVQDVDSKEHAPWGLPKAKIVLHRRAYSLGFDPANKIPLWVAYRAYPLAPEFRRPSVSFVPDPAIPSDQQASTMDYRGNPYDRGAMLSSADISTLGDDAVRTAFYLSVAAPQTPQMNRRTWFHLERYTRGLAAGGEPIYVISGPAFQASPGSKGIFVIGAGHVAVPTHFFRILARKRASGGVETIAFLVPNENDLSDDYKEYRSSVGEIEKITSLRFFPDLDDKDRQRVLADTTSAMWPAPSSR